MSSSGEADELRKLLDSRIRCVVVARRPVDLRDTGGANTVYVLQLPEGIRTAMGSRGGSGRSLVKVYRFSCAEGGWRKTGEFEDEEVLARLDLPYHATALGIVMPDGTERLLAGVVDEELAAAYEVALR